jgi:hypothetical protein
MLFPTQKSPISDIVKTGNMCATMARPHSTRITGSGVAAVVERSLVSGGGLLERVARIEFQYLV